MKNKDRINRSKFLRKSTKRGHPNNPPHEIEFGKVPVNQKSIEGFWGLMLAKSYGYKQGDTNNLST